MVLLPNCDVVLTGRELVGLREMRAVNTKFLESNQSSEVVNKQLQEAIENTTLMLAYLRGKKHNPKLAWETLKRNAEIRLVVHPEIFPGSFPEKLLCLQEKEIFGVLKSCDRLGRRIFFADTTKWDPKEYSLEELTIASVFVIDKLLLDEQCLENGMIWMQQCSGLGWRHMREYSLTALRRLVTIFWQSFPLKVKELYYVNAPSIMNFTFGTIKPFMSKKLKDRVRMSPVGKNYEELYQHKIPLSILPICLGGTLNFADAVDMSYFPCAINTSPQL